MWVEKKKIVGFEYKGAEIFPPSLSLSFLYSLSLFFFFVLVQNGSSISHGC